MKYKNGSREVDKRIIKIDVTPPHANATTYEQNHSYPPHANATTPPRANATENNTSKSNNTSINSIKDIVPFGEIIEYLNFRTGKDFRVTPSVRTTINARYEEGFNLQDFKDVIDKKCIEWINDSKMRKYLQPSTLFGTKFQNYLNQEVVKPKSDNPFLDISARWYIR
ncbi:conserved phage C-terminal domain-containing protein [Erysipelothrix sp. D19-032]